MSEIQKYAKEARTSPDLETGLFEKADGTQWIRNPDGTETPVIGAGGSQTLAQTLALGNDANALKITNLADGVDPQDAATVSQIGGSQAGAVRLISFPFAFDTVGLEDGVTVETNDWAHPAIGDILLDAWFDGDPDDIFDPQTFAKADIGRISAGAWVDSGWFNFGSSPGPVPLQDLSVWPVGGSVVPVANTDGPPSLSGLGAWNAASATASTPLPQRRMTTADPVKLVVSADGNPGGGDPGCSQGSCVLRMLWVTPA